MTLTETEKRIIRNLHLRGIVGSMGKMKSKDRLKLLQGLIDNGYLNSKCEPTKKGIEATAPFSTNN